MAAILVTQTDSISPGEVVRFDVNGEPVAIYNLGGAFFATHDICTHATASLAEGDVEEDRIVCPVHFGEFHIPTGQAVEFPCERNLRTYFVTVDGDDIYVDLDRESSALSQ
jgi:ethylbenzene dioxygenase ferredoxin subunit